MAGHTYVCKIQNLRELIDRMKRLAEGAGGPRPKFDYDSRVIDELEQTENERIKWFLYCDQQNGNTIRLYDSKFFRERRDLYKEPGTYVIFRGKNLGEPEEKLKKDIRELFGEIQKAPSQISINQHEDCLKHFKELNVANIQENDGNGDNGDGPVMEKYSKLTAETYLRASWFQAFENLLLEHLQVILEGPPGSGKTFVAERFAKWWTDQAESDAAPGSTYEVIQFHESYGYEDFFQGIRPVLLDANSEIIPSNDTKTPVDKMVYKNVNGVFYNLCKAAERVSHETRFVLIIDEINRGKTSRIFGELLYLLEYREKEIKLASGDPFKIPENVYIIGTMNTADRSIALVDYALRRRFKFVTLHPWEDNDAPVLRKWLKDKQIGQADDIVKIFCELNKRISDEMNEHLVVGHSYFMTEKLNDSTKDTLEDIWNYSILPLMEEYQPHLTTKEIKERFGLDAVSNGAGVRL